MSKWLDLTLTFIILKMGIPSPISQIKGITACNVPVTVPAAENTSAITNFLLGLCYLQLTPFPKASMTTVFTQRTSSRALSLRAHRKCFAFLPPPSTRRACVLTSWDHLSIGLQQEIPVLLLLSGIQVPPLLLENTPCCEVREGFCTLLSLPTGG